MIGDALEAVKRHMRPEDLARYIAEHTGGDVEHHGKVHRIVDAALGGLECTERDGVAVWHWHSEDKGGTLIDAIQHFERVDIATAIARAHELTGIPRDERPQASAPSMRGNGTHPPSTKKRPGRPPSGTIPDRQPDVVHEYTDADGHVLFEVVRWNKAGGGKDIRQRRPAPDGGYTYNLDGVERVLYNLPNVIEAAAMGRRVYVVEGEKCADALNTCGRTATTNPMGAGKWVDTEGVDRYSESLRGANVVILPDDDESGYKHAYSVAAALRGIAAAVKVVELYGRGTTKRDVVDWFASGHTADELDTIVDGAEPWVPDDERVFTWADEQEYIGSITWAWVNWLPNGLLTMLVSASGQGKSHLALRIAATFASGMPWPDGTPFTGTTGRVLWAESEGAAALNIERARSMGIPLTAFVRPLAERIGEFNAEDPTHLEALRVRAMREDVRVIIVDSLSGATVGRDENTASMLGAIKKLAAIASETQKPMLVLHHLNKGGDGDDELSLRHVRGSSSIVQLPRAVWGIDTPNADDTAHRRLSALKLSLAKRPNPLGFRITDNGVVFTPDEVPHRVRPESRVDRAVEFLRAQLQGRGAVLSRDVETAASAAGVSTSALKEGKKVLKVEAVKRDGVWYMQLPNYHHDPDTSEF